MSSTIPSMWFDGARALRFLEVGRVTSFTNQCMVNVSTLETLIIRNPDSVPFYGWNALAGSGVSKGNGYIYVPRNMVEAYKSATGWSEFGDQVRAIEDYPEITGGL